MLVSELEAGGELYITNRYATSGLYTGHRKSGLNLIHMNGLKAMQQKLA